jgi:hypothetical protein
MYQITIKKLSDFNEKDLVYIIGPDPKFEDSEFNENLEKVIEIYENFKNKKNRCRTSQIQFRSEVVMPFQNKREMTGLNNKFDSGLPNIRFSCYINSVIQALRIVFNELDITLNNSLPFSKSLEKLITSLNEKSGIYLNDYNNFLELLLSESWARGDPRDAKEFFTYILGKLKSEGNNLLNELFTTKITKIHQFECSYTFKQKQIKYDDSVTIINGNSFNLRECIKKRINNQSIIRDYPCDLCNRTENCLEIIQPVTMAKVYLVYFDPNLGVPITNILHTNNLICAISFTKGNVNHFKTYTLKKIYDDSNEISRDFYSTSFNFQSTRSSNIDLAYLLFIKA